MQKWTYWILMKYFKDGHGWTWSWDKLEDSVGMGDALQRVGRDGWELVSTEHEHNPYGALVGYYLYLKRPLE